MSFGLVVGDLTYLTAVVLGLALVAQTFGTVFLVIKWLGVAYLAWLAWSFWTSGITPENVEARKGKGGLFASFLAGLTVTLGNPKTMIFYLALTPTLVDLRDHHAGRLRDPRRADRGGAARRARALSGARRQGALVPEDAARAEGAEPHRGRLHGRRRARHRFPAVAHSRQTILACMASC